MKYNNLCGTVIDVGGFTYWCSNWAPNSSTNTGRGYGSTPVKICKHQICDIKGPLFGIECVYEATSVKETDFFIYPVTELERLDRVPKEIKEALETYSIY